MPWQARQHFKYFKGFNILTVSTRKCQLVRLNSCSPGRPYLNSYLCFILRWFLCSAVLLNKKGSGGGNEIYRWLLLRGPVIASPSEGNTWDLFIRRQAGRQRWLMSPGKHAFRVINSPTITGPGRNLPCGLKGNILPLMQTLLQKTQRDSLFRECQRREAATKTNMNY